MDKLLLKNQLCFPLYVASKEIIRKYKEYLDPLDLTYTQYIVMMVLWEENSINVKHLGERLYLDSGTLTPLLKKLETHEYISRIRNKDDERNAVAEKAEQVAAQINVAMENYPDLKAHQEIADVMQQNSYLQREITAAREVYNDTVNQWNSDLYSWPTKQIVAAKKGYTTRIPFTTSKEIKNKARDVFF